MKTVRALTGVALMLAGSVASATVSDADFQALKDQLSAVTKRLEQIQQEREQEKAQNKDQNRDQGAAQA